MTEIKPLQRRVMTLDELQLATLVLIRRMRQQLQRAAHEPGLSDEEFSTKYLDDAERLINQDREMLKTQKEGDS